MNVSGWFHLSQGKTFETGVVFWRSGWPIHNALVNLTPKGNWNVVVRGIPAAIAHVMVTWLIPMLWVPGFLREGMGWSMLISGKGN